MLHSWLLHYSDQFFLKCKENKNKDSLQVLTIHEQMKCFTEVSHSSIIPCSTRVVTIVQSVVKRTYGQFVILELVATRRRRYSSVSFLPCHWLVVFTGSALCDVTGQCYRLPFSWSASWLSNFGSGWICNRHRVYTIVTITSCSKPSVGFQVLECVTAVLGGTEINVVKLNGKQSVRPTINQIKTIHETS